MLPPRWKGWHGGKGGQQAHSGGRRANEDCVEVRGSGDEQGAGECGPGGEHKERGRGRGRGGEGDEGIGGGRAHRVRVGGGGGML